MNRISVIIPTCDRPNSLKTSIDSILKNTLLPIEIIIVDQSDLHGDINLLNDYERIIYIKDQGKGAARARNIGWRMATGEIISFIDDDAWAGRDWLKNIKASFELKHFNPGIVSGKIIPVFQEVNPHWGISDKHKYILPAYDQGEEINIFKNGSLPLSVNYSVKRKLLEETGGFNEKLGPKNGKKYQIFGEDSELSLRIKKMGYDIIYNPSVAVYHPVPMSRQHNEFVAKRLFIDGLTYVYMKRLQNDSIANRLKLLIITLLQYLKTLLVIKNKYLLEEKKIVYKGRIFGLIHSMDFLDQ